MRSRLAPFTVVACVLLQACATMLNPGHVARGPDPVTGDTVRTSRVFLRNWTPETRIYENDRQLPVYGAEIGQSADAATCEGYARAGMRSVDTGRPLSGGCRLVMPMLVLGNNRPYTLRIVQGSRQGTVTANASTRWYWFIYNGIWGVFYPAGLAVDASTGRWKYHHNLDIAEVLRSPGQAAQ